MSVTCKSLCPFAIFARISRSSGALCETNVVITFSLWSEDTWMDMLLYLGLNISANNVNSRKCNLGFTVDSNRYISRNIVQSIHF